MSDPTYVKLSDSYGGNLLYDNESKWAIAGSGVGGGPKGVKPFPSDAAQAAFVRSAILTGQLVSATRDEWEAANPPPTPKDGDWIEVGAYGAPDFSSDDVKTIDEIAGFQTGISSLRFQKMSGVVHIFGQVKPGGLVTDVADLTPGRLFTLPEGFRPGKSARDQFSAIVTCEDNSITQDPDKGFPYGEGTARVGVLGDGSVVVMTAVVHDKGESGELVPIVPDVTVLTLSFDLCFPVLR